jgi:glycosyltransferase involved in cell wall biosynthesis
MSLSVLMSVYNKDSSGCLREALQSLADQTHKAEEVILVEDGPISDKLQAVIKDFREQLNIKSVRLTCNSGLTVALNEGLKHCNHELVARMDADDISLPQRFERQVDFMMKNPEISISSTWLEEFNENGRIISYRKLPLEHKEIKRFAKTRSPINHPSLIFRKNAVLEVGGYPNLRKCQDHALASVMLYKGYKFANQPDVLLKMRTEHSFFKRRGYLYIKNQLALLRYQKQIGFINNFIFFKNTIIRGVICFSPVFIRKLFYKHLRTK